MKELLFLFLEIIIYIFAEILELINVLLTIPYFNMVVAFTLSSIILSAIIFIGKKIYRLIA